MSALNLRLPNSVHRHIRGISSQEGVSINQFIVSAVSEKISALTTEEYIAKRAKRAGVETFVDSEEKEGSMFKVQGTSLKVALVRVSTHS